MSILGWVSYLGLLILLNPYYIWDWFDVVVNIRNWLDMNSHLMLRDSFKFQNVYYYNGLTLTRCTFIFINIIIVMFFIYRYIKVLSISSVISNNNTNLLKTILLSYFILMIYVLLLLWLGYYISHIVTPPLEIYQYTVSEAVHAANPSASGPGCKVE